MDSGVSVGDLPERVRGRSSPSPFSKKVKFKCNNQVNKCLENYFILISFKEEFKKKPSQDYEHTHKIERDRQEFFKLTEGGQKKKPVYL